DRCGAWVRKSCDDATKRLAFDPRDGNGPDAQVVLGDVSQGVPAADVRTALGSRHSDLVLAVFHITMLAADGERAVAATDRGGGRGSLIAPVDTACEGIERGAGELESGHGAVEGLALERLNRLPDNGGGTCRSYADSADVDP